MALQRAFIWTQWAVDSEGANVSKVVEDWPHVLGAVTGYETVGGSAWIEYNGEAVFGPRVRPTRAVDTEGIRRWQDETGGKHIPPTPNALMGQAIADETVFTAMATAFVQAGDKSGLAIPVWRTYWQDDENTTDYEPADPFTQQEVGLISDWLNANGISNAGFVSFVNEQLGTSMTVQEVSAWMQSRPRQQFTSIVARVWRAYT